MAEPNPTAGLPTLAVTVRYFAAARAAAGLAEETVPVPAAPVFDADADSDATKAGDGAAPTGDGDADGKPDPITSVGAVIAAVGERHPDLTKVLPRCSFLLDEIAVHGPATVVRDGQVLDVLPPFAGG